MFRKLMIVSMLLGSQGLIAASPIVYDANSVPLGV